MEKEPDFAIDDLDNAEQKFDDALKEIHSLGDSSTEWQKFLKKVRSHMENCGFTEIAK